MSPTGASTTRRPEWPSIKRMLRPRVRARRLVELTSSPLRAMPDFLIIGAQKAGTTSLFDYLDQHPRIHGSHPKELYYFADRFRRGELWYRSHFPLRTRLRRGELAFEASPRYLYDPDAVGRIAGRLPHAKVIVLLRDATSRAISHYKHARARGYESLSLSEALDAESARLAEAQCGDRPRLHFYRFAYQARGLYAEQLRRVFDVFPREQVLVLDSADLFEDTSGTVRRTLEFLDTDPSFTPVDQGAKNTARMAMDPNEVEEARVRLDAFYEEPNRQLRQLLGWVPRR